MGKKKGKKQDENSGDTADDTAPLSTGGDPVTAAAVPGPLQQQKVATGGKKGRKKKQIDDDDIDAELLAIANEEGGTRDEANPGDPPPKPPAEQATLSAAAESVQPSQAGKKGKKGRKKDKDWEDDVLQELEQMSTDGPEINKQDPPPAEPETPHTIEPSEDDGGKKNKKGKKSKKDDDIDQLVMAIEGVSLETVPQSDATPISEQVQEEEEVHVKTKAEKKQAKKEKEKRQKELKKQAKQVNQTTSTDNLDMPASAKANEPETATSEPVIATSEPVTTTSEPVSATSEPVTTTSEPVASTSEPVTSTTEPVTSTIEPVTSTSEPASGDPGAAATEDAAAENEEEDDKKKKKKKKKKPDKEEDKKTAKAKKVKSAVQKMKEEIEALRQAQKKREEEELAKIRAAEEAERQRQEQLRLEAERKERRKQKEKEKKERLRKEGKLLSKSEKERRARANVHLQALVAQGIIVPQKAEAGERKGPVRYGSKVKKNKPQESATPLEEETESLIDEGIASISGETNSVTEEESVKDNWDDEEEEDDDVKDNWEDELDDEDDNKENDVPSAVTVIADPVVTSPVTTPVKLTETAEEEEHVGSGEESESEESDSDSSEEEEDLSPYEKAAKRIQERRTRHHIDRSPDLLRSPVVCVLGHVDTGKTKILDKIRHTHVQDGEAGGITQQIGATFVPPDAIQEQTKMIKEFHKTELKVPGLLIIDTPGHESFSNLRTRGSSMCDIAILVVDIMHGLEPQTIESLNLLRKGNVPYVVALNKIDRLYNWVRNPSGGVKDTLKRQKVNTKNEFDERVQSVVLQFAEQGVNAALFWDKVDFKEYVPMVPTSAHSGDGMGDLISLVVSHSEQYLIQSLMFSKEVEAIVLEVKVIGGLGTTIDVILRNGILNEGDTLVLAGTDGPIVTQARALLMPQPLRELRVKNAYINHKTIIASQGVKITGKDLEKVLAGMPLLVAKRPDEIDVLKDEASTNMSSFLNTFKLSERGVFVQASTLGSLEALVEFLKTSKIPYAGVNIGPVHKKDVMKASVMLERDTQWACILAFDVRVEREAQEMADSLGVRIFMADIIYHLFDNFMKYREELRERRRRENEHIAIFPCKLKILPNCVFNARNPIIMGVSIVAGVVKPGIPLVVPSKDFVHLGVISSIEVNHKPVDIARKGSEVCIKIEPTGGEAPKLFGRHFDYDDVIVSKISRESIDAVKKYFREDLQKADWQLMVELKRTFQIY